jgi:hypothetical protein
MKPDEGRPDEPYLDRRQVTLDPEAFDVLQRRVDAPGEPRAGAAELFERRRALDELAAISDELGLYDIEAIPATELPQDEISS